MKTGDLKIKNVQRVGIHQLKEGDIIIGSHLTFDIEKRFIALDPHPEREDAFRVFCDEGHGVPIIGFFTCLSDDTFLLDRKVAIWS